MPVFAANLTMMFTEHPFTDRFAAAADAGFTAVEYLFPYDWSPDLLAGLLQKHGLRQALFNLYPGDWSAGERGMACVPGREAEFMETVRRALPYAEALGCARVHAMAGIRPQGVAKERLDAVYLDNVRRAAELLADHSLELCLEPINRISMPGYYLNRQEEAVAVIQKLGLPNVRLQFDCFHCQMEEGAVSLKMREFFIYTGHYQIASVPDRHEPDDGELNYRYLFDLMDELGYTGYVGCEYNPAGRTTDNLTWLGKGKR